MYKLEEFGGNTTPLYAIMSHKWGENGLSGYGRRKAALPYVLFSCSALSNSAINISTGSSLWVRKKLH
jgi:hypothetical protein